LFTLASFLFQAKIKEKWKKKIKIDKKGNKKCEKKMARIGQKRMRFYQTFLEPEKEQKQITF